ncbi:hypothetical protein QOT17_002898 [Balamuthia mandrillaris]
MQTLCSKLELPAFTMVWFFLLVLLYFYFVVGPQSKENGQWDRGCTSQTERQERDWLERTATPFLFIGVLSTASNVKQRDALRDTWLSDPLVTSGTILVKFFISNSTRHLLSPEEQQHLQHQFVLVDCQDTYGAMFHKSEAIMEYGARLANATFVMKADDDTLIFPLQLMEFLKANEHRAKDLWVTGWAEKITKRSAKPESEFFIEESIWGEEVFPPYPQGGGYIMTVPLAEYFTTRLRMEHFPRHKWFEDLSIGLWIEQCKKEGVTIELQNDDRFVPTACAENVENVKHPFHMHRLKDREKIRCIWERYLEGEENLCCV